MQKYTVAGMSCVACVARVEKAVLKVDGVTGCAVSLLTNSMTVEGSAGAEKIIKAVETAGYKAEEIKQDSAGVSSGKERGSNGDDVFAMQKAETLSIRHRLLWSAGFLLVLMYVSMGHTMLKLPVPSFLEGNILVLSLLQMILSGIILVINQIFFINGFKSLLQGGPNMDTLVALGAGISFLWSTAVLFGMTDMLTKGNSESIMHLYHSLYFESAAMIVTLITVGKLLESVSKGRTTDALKALIKIVPQTAVVIRSSECNGSCAMEDSGLHEIEISVDEVVKDDIFVVRPGERIPVDGIVIEGSSSVDESAMTGESVPADKSEGSSVASGTVNLNGFLKCRAVRVGKDTAINRIIQMVRNTAETKAPVAKIADRVSGIFVPAVLALAFVTAAVWLFASHDLGFALARGISVLVISCPCALGLATPVAIMVSSGTGAKNGILFKNAEAIENSGNVTVVALDKTGTVTKGRPSVTDVLPAAGFSVQELLRTAASLEVKSEHPFAKAIVEEAEKQGIELFEVSDFTAYGGKGVSGTAGKSILRAGNARFFAESAQCIEKALSLNSAEAEKLARQGKTPLYFAKDGEYAGCIAVADVLKDDSKSAVEGLKSLGIEVVLLTGDNQLTAEEIARQAGIETVIAGVLPDQKVEAIKKLRQRGKICMIGDGTNDAPALAAADLGIAIGAGTDVAAESADAVLVKSSLMDAVKALYLGRKTLKNIKENFFWAFIYNLIGIPLAAGVFINLFGWNLNPMFGAAAMSLSSFCVVTNALRINLVFNNRKKWQSKNYAYSNGEEKTSGGRNMVRSISVKGMMCQHCEMHVQKALENIDGIEKAKADHKTGTVEIEMSKDVSNESLKAVVTDAGYEMTE